MRLSFTRLFWARTALSVAAASGCCWAAGTSAADTAHHHPHPTSAAPAGLWDGYQPPCHDSSWGGYAAESHGCQPRRPRLILGLLDSVAGGVEQVLGLSGPRSGHCDEIACDDGCDAVTLRQLRLPAASAPAGHPPYPAPAVMPHHHVPVPRPFVPGGSSERVPAPQNRDAVSDPFQDEQAGRRKINPAISPSAYFE